MWNEKNNPYRPRVVLAYVDSAHASRSGRLLRRHGWEVHLASSSDQAYQLVRDLSPRVVVLDTDLLDESGWLTCCKLLLEDPGLQAILLAQERNAQSEGMTDFVNAAGLVLRDEGPEVLLEAMQGQKLAKAV